MKCVNMISGGIDSSALTLKLQKDGYEVHGVMFDYGQENFDVTYKKAKAFTKKQGVSLKVIPIPQDWVKSSILKGQFQEEECTEDNLYKQDIKEMFWIPGRGIMFWTLAASYAASLGIEEIYSSIQMDTRDWKKYDFLNDRWKFGNGEVTPAFIELMNEVIKYSVKTPIKFIAPFIEDRLHANETAMIGKELGLDFDDTYSCRYAPACGQCAQCLIRDNRMKYVEENGNED